MSALLVTFDRQFDHKLRARATFRILNPDVTAVRFDDTACDRQSHSTAGNAAIRDVTVAHAPKAPPTMELVAMSPWDRKSDRRHLRL